MQGRSLNMPGSSWFSSPKNLLYRYTHVTIQYYYNTFQYIVTNFDIHRTTDYSYVATHACAMQLYLTRFAKT